MELAGLVFISLAPVGEISLVNCDIATSAKTPE